MLFWLLVSASIVAGVIGAVTAPKMGRSSVEAFLLGVFLWPVGLVMTLLQIARPAATEYDARRINDGLVRDRSADLSFAADPRTSPSTLEALARMYDQDQGVLLEIAKNPSTPKPVLEMFAMFKSEKVAQAAAIQLEARSR